MTTTALHEPKDAHSASIHTVYVSNGAGSGSWEKVDADSINTASINNSNLITLEYTIDDLSTAGSHYLVIPLAGDIQKIYSVIDQAIATANTILTPKIATVAVTSGAITIAFSGSAAGDVDSSTPSGANTVTAGQALEIACNGGTNTSNARAHITVVVDVT